MIEAGQSELEQGASTAVVQPTSRLKSLIDQGKARPARTDIAELAPPTAGPELTTTLAIMRDSN